MQSNSLSSDCVGECDEHNNVTEAWNSILFGRDLMKKGNYKDSIAFMTKAATLVPSISADLYEEIVLALHMLSDAFFSNKSEQCQIATVAHIFHSAIKIFPKSSKLPEILGNFFFKAGTVHFRKSLACYRYSLSLDGENGTAKYAYENLKGHLVDRWHFRMLNDRIRNECYDRTIQYVCKHLLAKIPDRKHRTIRVLDIGSGTGLLSMFASRCHPLISTTACEMNASLCDVAQSCVSRNNLQSQVTICHAHSSSLVQKDHGDQDGIDKKLINQVTIDEPFDLIVTELVDSGLLGERILETLSYARSHLLRPGGIIVPFAATVFAVCIESQELRRQKWVLGSSVSFYNSLEGFVSESFGSKLERMLQVSEPYSCVALDNIKYKCITNICEIDTVEFAAPGTSKLNRKSITLTVEKTGSVDAVAVWYSLHLLNRNSNVYMKDSSISTAPLQVQDLHGISSLVGQHQHKQRCSGWDQATFTKFDRPIEVCTHHSKVHLKMDWGNGLLEFSVLPTTESDAHVHNDIATEIKMVNKSVCSNANTKICSQFRSPLPVYRIGEMDMCLVNNTRRARVLVDAFMVVINTIEVFKGLSVLTIEDSISMLGHFARQSGADNVTCICNSKQAAEMALDMCPPDSPKNAFVTCASVMEVIEKVDMASATVPTDSRGAVYKSTWDILACEVVEGLGVLRQNVLSEVAAANEYMKSRKNAHKSSNNAKDLNKKLPHNTSITELNKFRYIIPTKIRVMCRAISSNYLTEHNCVVPGRNTAGIDVSAINSLSVQKYPGIDIRSLLLDSQWLPEIPPEFTIDQISADSTSLFLTETVECLCFDLADVDSDWEIPWRNVALPPVKIGTMGSIEKNENLSSVCDAILFWFHLEYPAPLLPCKPISQDSADNGDIDEGNCKNTPEKKTFVTETINTGAYHLTSHWRQAAIFLNSEYDQKCGKRWKNGDVIPLQIRCRQSGGIEFRLHKSI